MKPNNNKTNLNGNWFWCYQRGEETRYGLNVVSEMIHKDKSRSVVSELFAPASINVATIILISLAEKHILVQSDTSIYVRSLSGAVCVWGESNLFAFWCKWKKISRMGIGEAAAKYVCCACYQWLLYFIFIHLTLFSCLVLA